MSDLASAAGALGVPEPLVERSARAWASDQGLSYEDVLTAWAGGEAAAGSPGPAAEATDEPSATPSAAEAQDAPEPAEPATAAAPAAPVIAPTAATATQPVGRGRPPILDAPADRPLVSVLGGVGVVILITLLGFVFPALPGASDEVRSSNVPLSADGEFGERAYASAGCASCHTQLVRSVVADVGMGAVSLVDSDQILGYRRIGPDLSDVGSRLTDAEIAAVLSGSTHPGTMLSGSAVEALVVYLSESATSPVEETTDTVDETTGTTEAEGES